MSGGDTCQEKDCPYFAGPYRYCASHSRILGWIKRPRRVREVLPKTKPEPIVPPPPPSAPSLTATLEERIRAAVTLAGRPPKGHAS